MLITGAGDKPVRIGVARIFVIVSLSIKFGSKMAGVGGTAFLLRKMFGFV